MAKMYVANTTPQDREFIYRIPGSASLRTQRIGRGEQAQLSGMLSREEISSIVEQQAMYGMVAAEHVQQARMHVVALYSVDKPVSEAQMRMALERNLVLMGDEGVKLRQAAAVGIQSLIREEHPDTYLGANISVEEKVKRGAEPEVNEQHFHRTDGDYSNIRKGFDAPISEPKRRGRPRKVR